MCFGGSKEPKSPPPPPAERDANLEGVRKRAAANKSSGEANVMTGMNGIEQTGGTQSLLGA